MCIYIDKHYIDNHTHTYPHIDHAKNTVVDIRLLMFQACAQTSRRSGNRSAPSQHVIKLYKLVLGSDQQVCITLACIRT